MKIIINELWLVGKNKDNGPWEVQGIFDDKNKAIAACKNSNYFIGSLELNKETSEMTITWITSSNG